MATLSGAAGAVTFAGGAITGKLLGWKLRSKSKNIETTGAGDTVVERIHLVKDWEAEVEWVAPDQASWDMHHGLVGTNAAIALKRKVSDTNPFATGTGLYEEIETDAPADGAIKGRGRVVCSGTDLTFDTQPAT